MSLPAFSSKYVSNGRLFKRKHGYEFNAINNSQTKYSITVPYVNCKIDSVEIIGCTKADKVDFKVLDDALGSITTVPNSLINQYGFEVRLPDNFYKDQSKYEADLVQNMVLELTYYNNENIDKTICLNIDFHEVIK